MRSFLRFGFTLAAGIAVGMGIVSVNTALAADAGRRFFALRVVKLDQPDGGYEYSARGCVKARGENDEACVDRTMQSVERKCFETYLACTK